MKLTMHAPLAVADTTYTISFDFTSQDQRALLDYLQANNYTLLGYKGASGPSQVTAGLPTWFAEPFKFIHGQVEIDYTPKYKVYVFNKATIGAYTTIKMNSTSDEVGLGTSLVYNQDGSFTVGNTPVPPDSIAVLNNTESGTPDVTIGLAAMVNGVYLPFCAFTSTPQGSIAMTPHEDCALFAAQTDMVSGSVTAVAIAPGCEFSFSAAAQGYNLAIAPSTYQIISAGAPPVRAVPSGSGLAELLNH